MKQKRKVDTYKMNIGKKNNRPDKNKERKQDIIKLPENKIRIKMSLYIKKCVYIFVLKNDNGS